MTNYDLSRKLLAIAQSTDTDKEKKINNLIVLHECEIVQQSADLILQANKIIAKDCHCPRARYEGWKKQVTDYFGKYGNMEGKE
jgi:hypothetical protein